MDLVAIGATSAGPDRKSASREASFVRYGRNRRLIRDVGMGAREHDGSLAVYTIAGGDELAGVECGTGAEVVVKHREEEEGELASFDDARVFQVRRVTSYRQPPLR